MCLLFRVSDVIQKIIFSVDVSIGCDPVLVKVTKDIFLYDTSKGARQLQ